MARRPRRIVEPMKHLPCVTELLAAGVKFKVNTDSECLLDLRFSGQVLEIPQLKVEDWTEMLFRNMVALEQCHYPYESYITDYVAVLDFLVNTGRDVDILVGKKILVNWLGDSDSVANLFNSLWKNVTHSEFSAIIAIALGKLLPPLLELQSLLSLYFNQFVLSCKFYSTKSTHINLIEHRRIMWQDC
ncbi:hypothetical protein P8452_23567 [Trifolium repens]|nr:hypothetical protein P8452_23567 [Trifolium repens]